MARRTLTLTVSIPFPRRAAILVDDLPLRVLKTTGTGPYTLTVRPVTWFDRFLSSLRYRLGTPRRTFRRWQEARWDRQDAKEHGQPAPHWPTDD